MKMLMGIDGGGTKTSYSLADENGNIVLTQVGMGCSYKQHGFESVLTEMATQVAALLRKANCGSAQVLGACVGLPCYGEAPAEDARFAENLRRALHPIPLHIVNDAEIGWAGSLAGQPGINVVAGTGSMTCRTAL